MRGFFVGAVCVLACCVGDDDTVRIRDCLGGFRVPQPSDKGARFLDFVRRMEQLAVCIDPLVTVRGQAAAHAPVPVHQLLCQQFLLSPAVG